MLKGGLQWSLCYLLLLRSLLYYVSAFDATPRWGQATVVINDALFVYGGKTDEFNSYSYPSAPNTNDLLYLSLSSPFSAISPPWELASSSTNLSTSQGSALAWGTLSAFNTSEILLFGGQPGPNSPTVIVDAADSAALLNVFSRTNPIWTTEPSAWVGEPVRRMRHSSATAPSGLVFIFGGEKADGSSNALSDHFYFDPNAPSFTLLTSDNAPPDIYGHVSIILSDGRILVFGGYCQSQATLLPFSTIWILDTTNSPFSWTVITTANVTLPSPRIDFAAVLIADGKIIIHGGSDASLQTNFGDGWILDTTQNPMTWTPVDALSQLGGRRDHFAVSSGDQVIFGFGYADNGPAPAPLQIFNPSSGSFVPTYTPPPITSFTQTLPQPTQTSNANIPSSRPFSSTRGIHPTSTLSPNDPTGGTTPPGTDSNNTTAIAVGTTFGLLSLVVFGLGAAYYVRRHRRTSAGGPQFMALGADDDDGRDSPHFEGQIPAAGMHEIDEPHGHHRILSTLGITGAFGAAAKMRSVRNTAQQRRDMLADEDTRSFGEWYNSRGKDWTGGSSWSLRSILGGGPRLWSRDASTTSHGTGGLPTPWREKSDPFSDGASLMRDEETGFIGAAAVGSASSRPHARREMSYASHASSMSGMSYRDPFVDPIQEEPRQEFQATDLHNEHPPEVEHSGHDSSQPSVRYVPPLMPLRTVLPPLSQHIGHQLSPLSEHTSQSTLPLRISAPPALRKLIRARTSYPIPAARGPPRHH
ncbi:hypothetical protein BDZ97DRAFT_1695878 [Flammula alnicola]|nr:hypothetical protein BDZ97DRAFT_1695878 [Flammula alnicola]